MKVNFNVTSRAKARAGWEIRKREESLLINSVVNSDYLYFCGIVVTSQTYAARVVHSNNKFDYIAVYKLY